MMVDKAPKHRMTREAGQSRTARYQRALISFIDILGFKNLINSSSAQEILTILKKKELLTSKFMARGETIGEDVITTNFSDLIVNVKPLPESLPTLHQLLAIRDQLDVLGRRQFMLINNGIFVRGGITIDQIYVSNKIIFGPGLITAYELESQIAKWPIIAISSDIIDSLSAAARLLANEIEVDECLLGGPSTRHLLAWINKYVGRTDEGIHFVDYIYAMALQDSTTGDLDYKLENHKRHIVDAYRKYRHYKYEFLARYHDNKCKEYFPKRGELLIGDLS